jgi:hypothetical protein
MQGCARMTRRRLERWRCRPRRHRIGKGCSSIQLTPPRVRGEDIEETAPRGGDADGQEQHPVQQPGRQSFSVPSRKRDDNDQHEGDPADVRQNEPDRFGHSRLLLGLAAGLGRRLFGAPTLSGLNGFVVEAQAASGRSIPSPRMSEADSQNAGFAPQGTFGPLHCLGDLCEGRARL